MTEQAPLNVYWSPCVPPEQGFTNQWNMLYPEPKTLMSELMYIKNPNRGNKNYFVCPAASSSFKTTYVFYNGLESHYSYDFSDDNNPIVTPQSDTYLGYNIMRPPTTVGHPMVDISLRYIFFCEEPLMALFTPPYFSKPRYLNYGTLAPGRYDIGSWFRPFNTEFHLWDIKGDLILEEEEPLFYLTLETDRPVNLHRFELSEKLSSYVQHCVDAPTWQGYNLPLVKRYKTFKRSNMDKLVLKEIKENLIT